MAIYGYARVSTTDQDLDIQVIILKAAGCELIRSEKISGVNIDNRMELRSLLEFMREGDTLIVTRIDRLGRSLRDLQNIVFDLKNRNITLKATEQPIDTSTAAGKAFLDMLGVFAEFEHTIRQERQREGINKAKTKGVYSGRVKVINVEEVFRLKSEGFGATAIAKIMNISRSSIYRILKEGKNTQG